MDTKYKCRLGSVPFKCGKLFGKALEPILLETKGRRKILPSLYRQVEQRPSLYFCRPSFQPTDTGLSYSQTTYPHRADRQIRIEPDFRIETDNNSRIRDHFVALEVDPSVAKSDLRSNSPIGGRLGLFANQWEATTTNTWVLNTVRLGLTLEFLSTHPEILHTLPHIKKQHKKGSHGGSNPTPIGHSGCPAGGPTGKDSTPSYL